MNTQNTNWSQSVSAVVIRHNRVLLARHTYGAGKNLLIIPGGYLNSGETPQDAVKREFLEETGVEIEPDEIIGVRFNLKDWYVVFSAKYVGGIARCDNEENSEVIWLDIDKALCSDEVPDLTKKLIESAVNTSHGLKKSDYISRENHGEYSLYIK